MVECDLSQRERRMDLRQLCETACLENDEKLEDRDMETEYRQKEEWYMLLDTSGLGYNLAVRTEQLQAMVAAA